MRWLSIFVLSAACCAQAGPGPMYPNGSLTPQQSVMIFNPPGNSTGAYSPAQWTDYQTALTSILTSGAVFFLNESCTKASCTNLLMMDLGTANDGADWCPLPSGSIPNAGNGLDNWVTTTTLNGNLANLVIAPASYGNNSVTPAGLFGTAGNPGFAKKLDTDCSGTRGSNGGIYDLAWHPNTRYLQGWYIYDPGTSAYWQIQTGAAVWTHSPLSYVATNGVVTSTIDQIGGVVSGQYATIATSDPRVNASYVQITLNGSAITYTVPGSTYTGSSDANFQGDVTGDAGYITGSSINFSGTTTADGTAPNTFNWVKLADAPYQDTWVGSNYTGLANKAYSITLANATDACNGTTCTVTLSNPFVGTANVDKLTITGSNIAGLNKANALITAIGATTVTYSNTTGSCNPNCAVTSGTMTSARNLNMGMTNATIAVVESGLTLPYQLPAYVANSNYCRWLFNHEAGNAKVGYIGCGGSIGGEDNTSGMTGATGWRYGSESQYLSYEYMRLAQFHNYAKAANILLRGNIFLYTFQQAYADWLNSASLGTNGYQINDALAILAGNCNNVGAVQGDWCLLFNEYYNQPYPDWYGTYPMLELQFGSQLNGGQGTSTPGLDNAGNTGSLGADPPPSGNPNCIGCPFMGLLPLAKLHHATDMEVYDACDNFLAVDPNYPAGCSITSGSVDTAGTCITDHSGAQNTLTYVSIVAGDKLSIGAAVYSVTAVGACSGANSVTITPTAGVQSNVTAKVYADAALYQIASAAAFGDFIKFGYNIAGVGNGVFTIGGAPGCGPPLYTCSRADSAVLNPPPSVAPVSGLMGINATYTDPNFNNPVVRCTDGSTAQASNANLSMVTTSTSAGDQNIWNRDSTALVLNDQGNSGFYVMQFSAGPPMSCTKVYYSNPSHATIAPLNGAWSYSNKFWLYAFNGTAIQKFDFTSSWSAPVITTIEDFKADPNCNLPAGVTGSTWNSFQKVDATDTNFDAAFSTIATQGTGIYYSRYSTIKGCITLNTHTGQYTGNPLWGNGCLISQPCQITYPNNAFATDRFTIHDSQLSLDGVYSVIGFQACDSGATCITGPYFWNPALANGTFIPCGYPTGGTANKCGGHHTNENSLYINNSSFGSQGNFSLRTMALPSSFVQLDNAGSLITSPWDGHPSCPGACVANLLPVFTSTYQGTTTNTPAGCSTPNTCYPGPGYHEVLGFDTNHTGSPTGTGQMHRFAFTYHTDGTTCTGTPIDAQTGLGSVDQQGKFFALTSDMLCSLGLDSLSRHRSDVFVVQLR